jgi:2,4-dienoyl-CoA reductase-like NADH-dependent reductase (Old Yellow Enzyme family)
MNTLLTPIRLGDLDLKNRVVMAPLTRARASEGRIPNALMAQYYGQRATAGLILTEATVISATAAGYANTPGLWSTEQVEGWKLSTKAVHDQGGKIFAQLWHVGRVSDSQFIGGVTPVAPSAIAPKGHVSLVRPEKPYGIPRALETNEIPGIIADLKHAAENAKRAGFDGVELHGANGYLFDQFLQTSTNHRTDEYGGSLENRARFMLEAVDALIAVWGASRVGVHLAPKGDAHDMGDENFKETFGFVARELGKRKIAFIFLRDHQGDGYLTPYLKELFGGLVIANEGLTVEAAEMVLKDGKADLVSFGKSYIANPDLVERIQKGAPLNKPIPETFYAKGATGYTDYPFISKSDKLE